MIKLINDDCSHYLQGEEFKKNINGKKSIIVIDPPFNIKYRYANYKDNLKEEEYLEWLKKLLTLYKLPFVIIHYPEMLHKLSLKLNKAPQKVVSWVYNSNTAKQHRDIAFYDIKPDFNQVKQPYKNLNDKRIKERLARGIGGGRLYDWWNINQVKNVSKKNITHPCIMPLKVMENIIGILPKDALIIDFFSGSGTTALACKNLNRDFIGIEIDKTYYEESLRRLEK